MIRNVSTYLVDTRGALPKNFIFCRVEAHDGTVGWGEAYAVPRRERGIAEFMKGLGEMLLSLDQPTPANFMRNVTGWYDGGHLSIDFSAAASGLEVALWDIEGKRAGQPVCKLLGDVVTRSVPLYANMDPLTPGESVARLVERCVATVAEGFTGVKIYPMEYEPLEKATDCVRQVREAIGGDNHLLIDIWAIEDADYALAAAHEFAEFDPYWFEEPIAGERVDELAAIRRAVDMPIVTGERQAGLHHFRSILDREAADILNPDIVAAGGLLSMLEIGRLADARGVKMSPHCWNSTLVGTAAMIHAIAVMPNAIIGEYFPQYAPFFSGFGELEIEIANSAATITDVTGLGVRMNEDALASHEI